MLKLCFLALLGWFVAVPAQAGLFSDDDARNKIQLLEARVLKLEPIVLKLDMSLSQQTKSMLDLQGQIEILNADIRKLRGQNEELIHGLQEAEKRSKDFYVDLDTRLRHFESADGAMFKSPATGDSMDPSDPAFENRAIESAYALFKSGDDANSAKAFQEFLNKFPTSVHVANAKFWLGGAMFRLNNFKGAMDVYQELFDTTPNSPRAAEVLFSIANCQRELKMVLTEKKTLKQLVEKYPDSEAAAKARKLLAAKK